VRALKQIVQDHRRLFRIKLTEPATKSSCVGETPQKSGYRYVARTNRARIP
jgi:hypothetical protein